MNLLDDALSHDLEQAGTLKGAMTERVQTLADYACGSGAHGILFTCSAFGPAIEAIQQTLSLPVLKPNQAMFEQALTLAAGMDHTCRVGLITTFAPASAPMSTELREAAQQRRLTIDVQTCCAEGAMQALQSGDPATHDRLVAQQAQQMTACHLLLLAQFSMARALEPVKAATGKPVFSSPSSAVACLQAALHAKVP